MGGDVGLLGDVMTECRHGLSEDCPVCMQERIDAAFAICIMIVEEECGMDKKPAQGRDNYVHGKYDVGMAIVDRIKCAQRNPDETRMRVPAQGRLDPKGEMTKIAAECHRAKWQFDLSEDFRPSKSSARALILRAFHELHRIGDLAIKARDAYALTSTECGEGK